ncbi:MAG: hypothetical protein MJ210_03185, partial [Alphaproteobacteria bacterium]|nr:hypothetical protein [Alphaproteobacteria bacterium]
MINNPLAEVIRNAYFKNVISKPHSETKELKKNTLANILRHKRMIRFEQEVNNFVTKSGLNPVPLTSQFATEKDLLTFSLMISGYIRDSQKALNNLQMQHACDKDLIRLYQAAAKYSIECNDKVEGSKYIFHEHCDYCFWKIRNHDTLTNAKFNNYGFVVNPKRHNLIISMPFHIKETQEELQKWTSKYLNTALDDKNVFGSDVDVYLAHFPIEQPRGEKFALSLQTLQNPETYFTDVDMKFVQQNLSRFIGQDIKTDSKNNIISGQPYDKARFLENCRNMTVLSYCAGGAHAHRWLNAFSHLANQMYDEQTVKQGMKDIFVLSYAFLPMQKESKYSGVHFMSNYAEDNKRKEPFIKMFNPELYEKAKYKASDYPAHVSVMPDKRNYIVAFDLPKDFQVKGSDGTFAPLPDLENGHHMGVITLADTNSTYTYPQIQFKNILRNASLGKRGIEVFRESET